MKQLYHVYENEGRKIFILKCVVPDNLNSFDDYRKKLQLEWYKPKSSEDAQILIDKCSELSSPACLSKHGLLQNLLKQIQLEKPLMVIM